MQSVLHLDDRTIAGLVNPSVAERAVDGAFAAWGRGEAATTQRVRASGSGGGMASAMAAVVPPYCGGKLYATHPGGFTFLNALFDVDGALLATLDGHAITLLRTAAASSLAIRHLATPHAAVATVVGTGRQAWPHIEMLLRTLPQLDELRICGRTKSSVDALAAHVGADRATVTAHTDPGTAVEGAHIVITVTSANDPLFPVAAVTDDALVCAVGATKYDRAEVAPELVGRCAAVVCDDVAGSRVECGDLLRAAAVGCFDWDDAVELHAIAAGKVHVPRPTDAPVLFETQGVAIQDVAVSALAYKLYTQQPGIQEANR